MRKPADRLRIVEGLFRSLRSVTRSDCWQLIRTSFRMRPCLSRGFKTRPTRLSLTKRWVIPCISRTRESCLSIVSIPVFGVGNIKQGVLPISKQLLTLTLSPVSEVCCSPNVVQVRKSFS